MSSEEILHYDQSGNGNHLYKKDVSLPDSGARTAFDTGAVRDSMQGKGLPSMIPTCAIMAMRSEEHTSELQSRLHLVCRLLLEKKK